MNIADKPGNYTDFSGKIEYESTNCEVRNSTFVLLKEKETFKGRLDIWMIFKSGTVTGGRFYFAKIEHCDFRGREINKSVFYGGTFSKGSIYDSYWYNGKWILGEWFNGYDKFGRSRSLPPSEWGKEPFIKHGGIADKSGVYYNFTGEVKWHQSNFKITNGDFELNDSKKGRYRLAIHSGSISGGLIAEAVVNESVHSKDVSFSYSTWEGGTWESGTWTGGIWRKGVWEDGYWARGIWEGGTWEKGTWEHGSWYGGTWKKGKWLYGKDSRRKAHGEDDSPDKWDL